MNSFFSLAIPVPSDVIVVWHVVKINSDQLPPLSAESSNKGGFAYHDKLGT
jgi:hypothetical protein